MSDHDSDNSEDSGERRKKRSKTNANEVDLSNGSRKVWLVKVPEFVKEAWSKLPASATLGTLTVLNPAEENPEVNIHSRKRTCSSLPRKHDLRFLSPFRSV